MSLHSDAAVIRAEIQRRYELAGYAPGPGDGSTPRREWLRGITSAHVVRTRSRSYAAGGYDGSGRGRP